MQQVVCVINFKHTTFFFPLREENIPEVTPIVTKSAFSILMSNDRVLPGKLSEPKTILTFYSTPS